MIKIIKKNKVYIYFVLFFAIIMISYKYLPGDDIKYRNEIIKMGFLKYIYKEYTTWSGRLGMMLVHAFLIRYDISIWKILNLVMLFLFIKSFSLCCLLPYHKDLYGCRVLICICGQLHFLYILCILFIN